MRRSQLAAIALASAALVGAGCGSDDEQQQAEEATTALTDTAGAVETAESLAESLEGELEEALTRDLQEQNGSGITGTVKLEPRGQESVRVEIKLTGGDESASYPAHVHTGSCANLNPTPEYPLENVQNNESTTTINASPVELFVGEYAVNVHDAADPSRYVACADIPSAQN